MSGTSLKSSRSHLFLGFGLLLLAVTASAQQSLMNTVLEDFIRTQTRGLPGTVSFSISPLDPRTQLAPCQAFEPFMPSGAKLWGKSTVGVRCQGPANWTIYVPVTVNVHGSYLVSTRGLQSGATLAREDITTRSGDLTLLPASTLTDPAQAVGRRLRSGVLNNQPLRGDQVMADWAVQQGMTVRTTTKGPGFNVSSEGKALNNATEGQVVQVRTSSGQTVSGIARPGGIVEITN